MGVIHDKLLMSLAFVKSVKFTLPDIHIFSLYIYIYMHLFMFGGILPLKVQGMSRCAFK